MPIDFAPVQSIKSISQRTLFNLWERSCGEWPFPCIADFKPDSRDHDPQQLGLWAVEDNDGGREFRMRYAAARASELTSAIMAGKTHSEILPPLLRAFALETMNACADSGCAVYTIISASDLNGNIVDCERLLLPFGRHGSPVEQIITSLQLISLDRAVNRAGLLAQFEAQHHVSFVAKISASATQAVPAIAR
jgi:hypothetical protein